MVAMQVMSNMTLKNSELQILKTEKISNLDHVETQKKVCCLMDFVSWLDSLSKRGFPCG